MAELPGEDSSVAEGDQKLTEDDRDAAKEKQAESTQDKIPETSGHPDGAKTGGGERSKSAKKRKKKKEKKTGAENNW